MPDYSVTTLSFLFNERGEVLLAYKKRGFGVGKWNGLGGKVESGETPIDSARREIFEEVGVNVTDITSRGKIKFIWPKELNQNDTTCHIFSAIQFTGTPTESEECRPAWFLLKDIPYDQMWDDDHHWYPRLLAGQAISLAIYFDSKNLVKEIKPLV